MNKSELIAHLADATGFTKSVIDTVITKFSETVCKVLKKKGEIRLPHFTFKVKERPKRKGKNPKTGKDIIIPAATVPVIKATKRLKDAVN